MRILTYTTLFPNARQPAHGIFVENRLSHLIASGVVDTQVVAPVPWFPFGHRVFGRYGAFAGVVLREEHRHISVHHPRFPVVPKVGMTGAAGLLYLSTRRYVRRLISEGGDIDLIDAHYFYPDGVAAALLGKELGKPVVITARGTDISYISRFSLPRRQIQWAAREAAAIITVCRALKDTLIGLGVDGDKIRVLRNGVDLVQFRPMARDETRARLGLDGRVLLSVGSLIPRKGHDLTIRALHHLPGVLLMIAGEGPQLRALERLADDVGVSERVRFLGLVPHGDLAELYSAADALVLASSREGWANVLLEAMACGTPVVASDIPGNEEVICDPTAGRLFAPRTAEALATAVNEFFLSPPSRQEVRAYAERFGWDETTAGQISLFHDVLGTSSGMTSSENDLPASWRRRTAAWDASAVRKSP